MKCVILGIMGSENQLYLMILQDNTLDSTLLIDTTKEPSAVFENLEAKQTYKVKIFVVSSGGWNQDKFLLISATTKATGKVKK